MGNQLAGGGAVPLLFNLIDVRTHPSKESGAHFHCAVSSSQGPIQVVQQNENYNFDAVEATVLSLVVYESPEASFVPEMARRVGSLRIPVGRLVPRYEAGVFQQWFNLDTVADPSLPAGNEAQMVSACEEARAQASVDAYSTKVCISLSSPKLNDMQNFLQALVDSHKQIVAYNQALFRAIVLQKDGQTNGSASRSLSLTPQPQDSKLPGRAASPTPQERSRRPLPFPEAGLPDENGEPMSWKSTAQTPSVRPQLYAKTVNTPQVQPRYLPPPLPAAPQQPLMVQSPPPLLQPQAPPPPPLVPSQPNPFPCLGGASPPAPYQPPQRGYVPSAASPAASYVEGAPPQLQAAQAMPAQVQTPVQALSSQSALPQPPSSPAPQSGRGPVSSLTRDQFMAAMAAMRTLSKPETSPYG